MFLGRRAIYSLVLLSLFSIVGCSTDVDTKDKPVASDSVKDYPFGSWFEKGGRGDFLVTKASWGGEKILDSAKDSGGSLSGHVITEKSATEYHRIDWKLESSGTVLYVCEQTSPSESDVKKLSAADATKLDSGCDSYAWKKLGISLALIGEWRGEGDVSPMYHLRSDSSKVVQLDDSLLADDAIEGYDNDEAFYIGKNATSGLFTRYNWEVSSLSEVYLCAYPSGVSNSAELFHANVDGKVDRSNLTTGCNGGKWEKIRPNFLPGLKTGWTKQGNVFDASYSKFDEKSIVDIDTVNKGIVTRVGDSYSYYAYEKLDIMDPLMTKDDSWRTFYYCSVVSGQKSIEDAFSIDLSKIDRSDLDNGCNGGPWTAVVYTPAFTGGEWIGADQPVVFKPTMDKWLYDWAILDEGDDATGVNWVLTTDSLTLPVAPGLSTFSMTKYVKDGNRLYTCPLASKVDTVEKAYTALLEKKVDSSDLEHGCEGYAWKFNQAPIGYLGSFSDLMSHDKYDVKPFEIDVTKGSAVEKLSIVEVKDPAHLYVRTGAPGSVVYGYVSFFRDSANKLYYCELKNQRKQSLDGVKDSTVAAKADETNLTTGCDGSAWVSLDSDLGEYVGSWKSSATDVKVITYNSIDGGAVLNTVPIGSGAEYTIYNDLYGLDYSVVYLTKVDTTSKPYSLYYCVVAAGESTQADAESAATAVSAKIKESDKTSGCNGFPWTKYELQ